MPSQELSLPDGYLTNPDSLQIVADKPALTFTNRENSSHVIPEFLKKYAPPDSWFCLSVEEILQNKIQEKQNNIYIQETLLKAYNPNLVFEKLRRLLSEGVYISFRIVTAENIKFKIRQKFTDPVFPVYYTGHFLFRRFLPKLKGFRNIGRLLNVPVDISKAEIIGRLIYSGFDIVDLNETINETIVVARVNPTNNPSSSKPLPDEGFLFSMQRVGQYGKPITVYKFRSMHPYAEYVQEYLHKTNGIERGGKFKNDFRVSTGGRIIRKYWIDELPMLFNLLKRDIKLVGVRPLSEHYFGLYPAHLQDSRRKQKPGLLPPFYADLPGTLDEIIASEINYLNAYEQNPLETDLLYLKKILQNIIVHKVRSK